MGISNIWVFAQTTDGAASSVVVDASRRRERTTANRAATKTKREQDRCSLCLARIIVTGLDISAWIQQLHMNVTVILLLDIFSLDISRALLASSTRWSRSPQPASGCARVAREGCGAAL